jgi:PqqD family protein of HPr-rel-A system
LSLAPAALGCFAPREGLLIEALAGSWAVYSPVNGETALLNDESAAILEILGEAPRSLAAVVDALAQDSGQAAAELAPLVAEHWQVLVDGGLIGPSGPTAPSGPQA